MQSNDIIGFLFSRGHSAHRVAGKHAGKGPAWLWGGMRGDYQVSREGSRGWGRAAAGRRRELDEFI